MSRFRNPFSDTSSLVVALIAAAAVAIVWWRDGTDRVLAILGEDLALFAEILPKVLAGTLIGAFLALLLPREIVARWVGAESGLRGLVVATLAGALVPGGPFTVYPVTVALLAAGADAGAAVAFVTACSLVGAVRGLVYELPFMGADFVLWRSLLALPLPVFAGAMARLLAARFPVGGPR